MESEREAARRAITRRSWLGHLWNEWIVESRRQIAPAFARPTPDAWSDDNLTAAWIGHSTVLINFFGIRILTDPVLFPRRDSVARIYCRSEAVNSACAPIPRTASD